MGQKKLLRFNQIKSFSNVLEYPKGMAGKWNEFFGNNNDIVLELACGRGEYTLGLSALHTNKNFIGIDVKGNRMYMGAKKAIDANQKNAAFLRTQIEMITDYFTPGEVSEMWITFPDPQVRTSKAKKRLTHPRFLKLYHKILNPQGIIHLKTDSPDLFHFTKLVITLFELKLVSETEDVYGQSSVSAELKIKTHYEGLNIANSKKMFYLCFQLPDKIEDRENELKMILQSMPSNE